MSYHSPHKFQHRHIQYGIAQSETVADFKAVSLNVMHESMDIIDEIYSRLDSKEVSERIGRLGKEKVNTVDSEQELFKKFQEFLEWRKTR